MRKIFEDGKLVEVQLEKSEQMWLMKENRKLMQSAPRNMRAVKQWQQEQWQMKKKNPNIEAALRKK